MYATGSGSLAIVLVERSPYGPHPGQLAFPGGKPEVGDADLRATALREAAEETGIDPGRARIVAPLPAVTTLTSGFRIQPYLARITPPERWRPDTREIARVVVVDATALAAPGSRRRRDFVDPAGRSFAAAPCFDLAPGPIWGATYRILEPLVARLARGEIAAPDGQ